MTPDPITTAREALPYVYHPGVSPELWAESLAKVNAAFDYAEKLQSALSVTQEEGRTEIARLEAEVEKLKAERDVLQKEANNAVKSAHGHAVNLNKIITAILPRDPMCRDCADEDGTCPYNDGLPCDPYDEVIERFRRLTSQLEQAERVIAPFADENEAQVEERPASVKDSASPYMFYRATYADLAALSQWIKDRQAKTGDK